MAAAEAEAINGGHGGQGGKGMMNGLALSGSLAYIVASAEKGEMGDERRRMLAILSGTVLRAQVRRKKERDNLY